jgi:tetrahydromethanopterin S-methyltransferase subunit G
MDSIDKLLEISSRLEHLEKSAEWIARESVHSDNAISQTGSLICVLADEIREKVCNLVQQLEKKVEYSAYH